MSCGLLRKGYEVACDISPIFRGRRRREITIRASVESCSVIQHSVLRQLGLAREGFTARCLCIEIGLGQGLRTREEGLVVTFKCMLIQTPTKTPTRIRSSGAVKSILRMLGACSIKSRSSRAAIVLILRACDPARTKRISNYGSVEPMVLARASPADFAPRPFHVGQQSFRTLQIS